MFPSTMWPACKRRLSNRWGPSATSCSIPHGCWVGKARRYLHAVFPQCLFSTIHDNGRRRAGRPRARQLLLSDLHGLGEAVYRERGARRHRLRRRWRPRCSGRRRRRCPNAEETTWVLLQSLGEELRGGPFVYDLRFSDRIPEAARQLGAEPLAQRGEHAFLGGRMRKTGAVFGANLDGHYFYRAREGNDDSLYTVCRLVAYLARAKKTLAELRRQCPRVYMTPELRLSLPCDLQPRIIEQVRAVWATFAQPVTGGVRVNMPGGWGLVQASLGEPVLCVPF